MKILVTNDVSESRKKRGSKKKPKGRSGMLKTVMPKLSGGNGDELIRAIENENAGSFIMAWNKIGKEIEAEMREN